jgi:hypothetical protein
MKTKARARAHRVSLRTTLIVTAALSASGLLLAACSAGPSTSSASAPRAGAAGQHAPAPGYGAQGAPPQTGNPGSGGRTPLTTDALVSPQSIIYTANLTITAKNVASAATAAATMVDAVGGYVSSEQEFITPGRDGSAQASLELKIPVAQYAAMLTRLAVLGKQTSISQQAQDVTQQVADVTSRVISAQAAIRQLRTLLSRAGSIGDLLSVQDQINSQESALEALLAQQRALSHETSYGTISLLLVSHHVRAVKHAKKTSHGFAAGLGAGWRGLKVVVTGLLTALGAALPFVLPVALLLGIGYGGRRWLARRRTPRAATPPAAS